MLARGATPLRQWGFLPAFHENAPVVTDQFAAATRTTTRLLDALKDRSNESAWSHLDMRYRRVIASVARRHGLSESDAEEVAQQTLAEFSRVYRDGRYDRSQGRLSSWILGMARNIILHQQRDSARHPMAAGSAMADLPDGESLQAVWDDERDRILFDEALGFLREDSSMDARTLLAFELVALRGVPAAEAAQQSGMSTDQVYVARSRVTKRLRALVQELTEAFEEDV